MAIAVALVGSRGTTSAASVTTVAGNTAATGSTFAAYVSWDVTAGAITAQTDNAGNGTYTAIGTPQLDGIGGQGQWFVVQNGLGRSGHTFTFTTASTNFGVAHLFEITGAAVASLDVFGQTQYTGGGAFTITTSTLGQAAEIVLTGCNANAGGSNTNPYLSGNTTILSQEPDSGSFWSSGVGALTVASTAAVSPSFTKLTATQPAGLAYVTFKEASASPTITAQPQPQAAYQGQTATFNISATASAGSLSYQWKDDGANVGTNSSSYTTAALVPADNGAQITCVVTDANGSTTSNAAILTVLPSATLAWISA